MHHHKFVLDALVGSMIKRDPVKLELLLRGPVAEVWLEDRWAIAGEQLPSRFAQPMKGLDCRPTELADGTPCAVVTLPGPQAMGEPYLALMIFGGRRPRLFTLERHDPDGGVPTMLGEWVADPDGSPRHINYGPGPQPRPDLLVTAVERFVMPPAHAEDLREAKNDIKAGS